MEELRAIIQREFGRLNWLLKATAAEALVLQAVVIIALVGGYLGGPASQWLPEVLVGVVMWLVVGSLLLWIIKPLPQRLQAETAAVLAAKVEPLRAAGHRARALQIMAATLSATLSFERVMEVAIEACSQALDEQGVPARSWVGAVFLFDGDELAPVASRRFVGRDVERRLPGKLGAVAEALRQAEPLFTGTPGQDPELKNFVAFQNCRSALLLPLRAGYQLFGLMVFGSEVAVDFGGEERELLETVAHQAVMALQNAELYQKLEMEKRRLIAADEAARKALARDLHDGPTQTIAAVAMHLNYVRAVVARNPTQAAAELAKVEQLAKQATKEIRGMLFTLRPLVLETEGLAAAIETAMNRIGEDSGIEMRLVGGEQGKLLDGPQRGEAFYVIEEALTNARKHSQATLIEVRLSQEGEFFVARVRDNGVGFDQEGVMAKYSSRGSLGMVNMRERAERIGGSLHLEAKPGRGTCVTLVVPLIRPDA
ncbi:MAG: GAF domain-containing sensor histidine kinase [Chloroflexota bacterium]